MESFLMLTRLESRIILRSKIAVFWTFLFPVLLMLAQAKLGGPHPPSLARIIAGVSAIVVVSTALMGFAAPLVQAREMGTLSACAIWPMPKLRIIGAMAAARLQVIGLAVCLVIAVACAALRAPVPGNTLAFAAVLLLGAAALLTFGAAVAARVRQLQSALALSNILYFGMIFLGGLFFDPQRLDPVAAGLLSWLPVNALVNGLAVAMGAPGPALIQPVLALTGFLALSAAFIDRTFDWSVSRPMARSVIRPG